MRYLVKLTISPKAEIYYGKDGRWYPIYDTTKKTLSEKFINKFSYTSEAWAERRMNDLSRLDSFRVHAMEIIKF